MTRLLASLFVRGAVRPHRFATSSTTTCRHLCTAGPEPPSASSNDAGNHYDVVVCGGGMVGLAAALALARDPATSRLRVLVVERGRAPPTVTAEEAGAAEYGLRTVALNPTTVGFLEASGAWRHVRRWGCIRQLRVWESTVADSLITFDGPADNDGVVARVVENDEVSRVMKLAVDETDPPSNVEFRYGASLDAVELPPSVATLATVRVDGAELTAKLVVGSDGAQSLVRRAMPNAARAFTWEYDQQAVVANVDFEPSLSSSDICNEIGWQRFLSTGPIAFLPLTLTKSNLIWSTTRAEAKRLMALGPEAFVDAVNDAFVSTSEEAQSPIVDGVMNLVRSALNSGVCQQVLGSNESPRSVPMLPPRVVAASRRGSFPIAVAHAVNYVAPRAVLVGDAAHRIHPMAGMGVNLGFGDVLALRGALAAALDQGADIGATAHLYPYESERQRRNLVKMVGVDALYRLYRTTFLPVALARAVGLNVTDALTPVKQWIVNQASR